MRRFSSLLMSRALRSRRYPRRAEPKWGGSKLLPGLHRPLAEYPPVLALTILRESANGLQILVGVRDPWTNRTHPDVASVPTRRVPELLAREWQRMIRRGDDPSDAYPGLYSEIVGLLGLKLGLADPSERGEITFRTGSVGASQGISVIGERDDAQETENLTMFNANVLLEMGSDKIPRRTASYSSLVWAELDAFTRMVELRDVGQLGVGLDAFVCAYGLCLQTSRSILGSAERSSSALFTRSTYRGSWEPDLPTSAPTGVPAGAGGWT
jgi:hypothetical protein